MPCFLRRNEFTRADALRIALVIGWGIVSIGGVAALAFYESRPGAQATAPTEWPAETSIPRQSGAPTLVMFAHPHCPCTRASLAELERIVSHTDAPLQTVVVFFKPTQTDEEWEQTDLWRTAESIPGVAVLADRNEAEAHRFGARTSGQALLYGPAGELLFNGGITGARGHQGDNAGRDSVENLIARRSNASDNAPVFGCPLSADANHSGEKP